MQLLQNYMRIEQTIYFDFDPVSNENEIVK
jgi:hypothetical protein